MNTQAALAQYEIDTQARIAAMKIRDAARRAQVSCLAQFRDVQKLIAEAALLKNDLVRKQVQYVIECGLENADDTCCEREYAREVARDLCGFAKDFPTRAIWWRSMFYASAQSIPCYPHENFDEGYLHGAARRWLIKRGLHG